MLFFKKRKYMSWHEFMDRALKIETLMFISKTTEQAVNNHWNKEVKNGTVR